MMTTESAEASLGSFGGGAGRLPSGGERTARIKELELAMNKRMLKHRLVGGIGIGGTNTSAEMEAKMEVVGESLDRRASLEKLTNQGVFQVPKARCCMANERCLVGKWFRIGLDARSVSWPSSFFDALDGPAISSSIAIVMSTTISGSGSCHSRP